MSGEEIPLASPNGGADDTGRGLAGAYQRMDQVTGVITSPGLRKAESMEALHLSLHQCARDGDVESMHRLLSNYQANRKKKVNLKDDENLTALHYAARYNHLPAVQMLLANGADPNSIDDEDATPLHFAARYKRMRFFTNIGYDLPVMDEHQITVDTELSPDNSVILYLVESGCQVNRPDKYGCTALHFAAMRGNEVATKELLSCKDIQIEAVDKQKMTAMHMAASHNEIEIIRMLIQKGATLRCCDEELATPLHYACMEGSVEVVNLLFLSLEAEGQVVQIMQMVTDTDNQQNTPLHLAVENRSYDVTRILIDREADVNVPRSNYQTPLHLAAIAGDVNIAKLLIEKRARVNALDVNQETPLYKAAAHNQYEMVTYLQSVGGSISNHDKDGFSPLLIAACNGHAETVGILLEAGADVLVIDKNDKSALYWAAEEDNLEVMQLLLAHKAVKYLLDITDRYANTALHIAAKKGYLNCVKVLLDGGSHLDAKNDEEQTALHLAARHGKTIVVKELVRRDKTAVKGEDEDSNTALHLAALAGHNKVVQALISAGADIEAKNANLWTPLDCASDKGWHKTIRVLLDNDSPVDPEDRTSTTPLLLAAKNGHVAAVNLLIERHAKVGQLDKGGNNCLDLAINNGHRDVAMAIVNSKKWEEALMNEQTNVSTLTKDTPLRKLIRKMPDVAEAVFNQCTTSNITNSDDPEYTISFNFEFLDDMYASWKTSGSSDALSTVDSIYDEDNHLKPDTAPYSVDKTILKKNHPLMIMVKAGQEDLLAHPLVTSLLHHKWSCYGRYFYYINFFIYCVFLTFLTGYLCTTEAPLHEYRDEDQIPSGLSECEKIRQYGINAQTEQPWFAAIGKYVVMGLCAIYILKELFQLYNAKWDYFNWENLIEWCCNVCALLLVIDFNTCQQDTGIRTSWQWQLGAVAIFLAWMDLVLFIRKFPKFGIYVVMFTVILSTFIQFLPVFLLFVVAFALGFFVLLQNQGEFENPGKSLIKTSVMLIGEFEFVDIFFGSDDHSTKLYYSIVSYALFVAFLIIMSILIMNLLVGLAVDDIKAVQEQAILKRMAMQVELALDVESVLPHFFRKKFVIKCLKVRPHDNKTPWKRLTGVKSMSSEAIAKALDPELTEMETLQENQDEMKKQIQNLRQRIKTMSAEQDNVKTMLAALLKHHGITIEEEDVQDDTEQ